MFLFLILCFLPATFAKWVPYDMDTIGDMAAYSCNGYLPLAGTFCDPSHYSCFCDDINGRATFMGCVASQGRNEESVLKKIVEVCLEGYFAVTTVEELKESYQYYLDNAVHQSDIENFNISEPVNVPIIVNDTLVNDWKESYNNFLGIYIDSFYYGLGLFAFWPAVMLVGAIIHWGKYFVPAKVPSKFGLWIQKNILLPATFGKNKAHYRPFAVILDFLQPSRLETMVITAFVLLTIAMTGLNISYYPRDKVFVNSERALSRYIAVRSGILGTYLAPLLVLFAGRNNFLQWVTGWKYSTFVTYHRWIGRVVVLLVIVHSICYSITFKLRYKTTMAETYVVWGFVGTICGGFILVQGLLVLRRKSYEIFLAIHILLAIFYFVGSWYHIYDLGYAEWYLASVVVWAFDRFCRIIRMSAFGFPVAQLKLTAGDVLRVTFPKPSYWNSQPGSYVFINFFRPSCFWQSHPFTVAYSSDPNTVVLYCKIKGGITHGLYKFLANNPDQSALVRVAVDGPYGKSLEAKSFDTAVFVAGGNGIPGIHREALDLAVRGNKKVKLYWIVREKDSLEWFHDELKALEAQNMEAIIYVTRLEETEYSEEEKKGESEDKSSVNDLQFIDVRYGRPNLDLLVRQEIEESNGSIAFVTCGPPAQVDELRYVIKENLVSDKKVGFYEQLQVWS